MNTVGHPDRLEPQCAPPRRNADVGIRTEDAASVILVPPPGLCLGVPTSELLAFALPEEDARAFWRGYALGGAVLALLLLIELVFLAW